MGIIFIRLLIYTFTLPHKSKLSSINCVIDTYKWKHSGKMCDIKYHHPSDVSYHWELSFIEALYCRGEVSISYFENNIAKADRWYHDIKDGQIVWRRPTQEYPNYNADICLHLTPQIKIELNKLCSRYLQMKAFW